MHSFYIIKELLVNQHRIKFLTSNNKILCIYNVFFSKKFTVRKDVMDFFIPNNYRILVIMKFKIIFLKVLETHLASSFKQM